MAEIFPDSLDIAEPGLDGDDSRVPGASTLGIVFLKAYNFVPRIITHWKSTARFRVRGLANQRTNDGRESRGAVHALWPGCNIIAIKYRRSAFGGQQNGWQS